MIGSLKNELSLIENTIEFNYFDRITCGEGSFVGGTIYMNVLGGKNICF